IALDGDSLLVGAPYENNAAGESAGVAYVFTRSGSEWTQQQRLVVSPFERVVLAGSAVGAQGDPALVGVPAQPAGGKVAVFERTAGVWTETAALVPADQAPGSRFGHALALSGDTAIVGAPERLSAPGVPEGAAY